MNNNTQENSLIRRIIPQNILLVLLLVLLCLACVWLYTLNQKPLYVATMEFSLSDEHGAPLDAKTRQESMALLLSQAIYDDFSTNVKDSDFTRQNFYQSLYISQSFGNIVLQITNPNAISAQNILDLWFRIFQEKINNINQVKKSTALKAEIQQRNQSIKVALQDFRTSIENSQFNLTANHEVSGLYEQLVAAIGNRIAYDAQIQALVKNYELKQSPLSLEFVAQNREVVALSAENDRLHAEIAHMKVQLGKNHQQIKAMEAEAQAIYNQLQDKIHLVVEQIYSNAEIATSMEKDLRQQVLNITSSNGVNLDNIITIFEQKLLNVWQDYQKMSANSVNNTRLALIERTGAMHVERQSVFIRFKDIFIWSGIAAFVFFYLLILLLEQLFGKKSKNNEHNSSTQPKNPMPSKSPTPEQEPKKEDRVIKSKSVDDNTNVVKKVSKFIYSLEEILEIAQNKQHKSLLLVGEDAAKAAARLALLFKKHDKNILLIDVSANQIENLIGPHRGLTDVLTADARIIDVIYKDHETAIDILPKGIASTIRAKEFEHDLIEIIALLQKDYGYIIFVMDILPEFGLNQIATYCQSLVICSDNLQEQDNWQNVLTKYKKKSLYFMSLFE